jgi:uncharacterized protein YkwD
MRRPIALALLAPLAAAAAACSGQPRQIGAQPSWRHQNGGGQTAVTVGPVTFAPSSEAATRYNESVSPPPSTPLGDAVVAAVQEAAVTARTQVPVPDARLFRACAELAAIVPEEGIVSYSLVEFALQRNGIIEPSPHLLVVWGDLDDPKTIVDQLRPRLAEILGDRATARVGIGVAKRSSDGTGAVVFALQGSGLTTAPIPRALPAGGSFALDARIEARYREPEVFVTYDDGSTSRVAATENGNAVKANVACGKHTGRQQVEITASDVNGSTVLANFPVWCGTQPPSSMSVDIARDDTSAVTPEEAERRLLAQMNHDREAAGVPPVVWDDRVADVARKHSDEMRRTRVVAHISPTTGSAADRVRNAGIKTAVVLENVARAYGVTEAHSGLMNSPGHRANILSPSGTHVGIGVVFGDEVSGRKEMFISEVFIRIPPKLDPAAAAEVIHRKLSSVRKVDLDPRLALVAQEVADGLAAGKTRDQMWPVARRKLDQLANVYVRIASAITAAADIEVLEGSEMLGSEQPDHVGIGVAQGPHPEIGEGAAWIVVLMAQSMPLHH